MNTQHLSGLLKFEGGFLDELQQGKLMYSRLVIHARQQHRLPLRKGSAPAALMKVGGLTLLERAAAVALKAGIGNVSIVIEGDQPEIEAFVRKRKLSFQILPSLPVDSGAATVPSNLIFNVAYLQQRKLSAGDDSSGEPLALLVRSQDDLHACEEALYRFYSRKKSDARFALLMRRYAARVLTRWLLRTPLTANGVSILGLLMGLLAGASFAAGGFGYTVLGSILFYISAVLDYCDGAVARIKLQDTATGTWLESTCDTSSYLAAFIGMAAGLYRFTGDSFFYWLGAAAVFGMAATFIACSRQRREIGGNRPGDYYIKLYSRLKQNQTNALYVFAQRCAFIPRRAALPYFVFIFALLNLTPVLLFFVALGANIMWVVVLVIGKMYYSTSSSVPTSQASAALAHPSVPRRPAAAVSSQAGPE
ncbi:MAG: CDP-alcohol phosphatidyltransferase family protein [Acidobacteria bacterium]|nr:CDP-alcohol phosphatidyltransferase family protein [Acidobacteriota bacterium]